MLQPRRYCGGLYANSSETLVTTVSNELMSNDFWSLFEVEGCTSRCVMVTDSHISLSQNSLHDLISCQQKSPHNQAKNLTT